MSQPEFVWRILSWTATTNSSKLGWEFQYNSKLFKGDFLDVMCIVKTQMEACKAVCRDQNKAATPWVLPVLYASSIQNEANILPTFIHKTNSTTNWYERFMNADILRFKKLPWRGFLSSSKNNPNSFMVKNMHCNFAIIQIFLVCSVFAVAVVEISHTSSPSLPLSRNSFKMITEELTSPTVATFESVMPSWLLIVI